MPRVKSVVDVTKSMTGIEYGYRHITPTLHSAETFFNNMVREGLTMVIVGVVGLAILQLLFGNKEQ